MPNNTDFEYKKITQEEFEDAYEKHLEWLHTGKGKQLDLSDTDLTNIDFGQKTLFRNANLANARLTDLNLKGISLSNSILSNADLVGVNLNGSNCYNTNFSSADLSYANLNNSNIREANFRYANLDRASLLNVYLTGARFNESNLVGVAIDGPDISEADFENTIYENIILKPSNKIQLQYQTEIEKLESERLQLLRDSTNKEDALKENEALIAKLQAELNAKSRSTAVQERIRNIFKTLDEEVTDKIRKEQKQLRWMFGGYFAAAGVFLIILGIVWIRFFMTLAECTEDCDIKMDITNIWINISPSVFLVSLIVLCVCQAHKCQRQLLAVSELLYNHQLVRSNLSAIIDINGEENITKSVEKVSSMFEQWANQIIGVSHSIEDIENEKSKLDDKEVTGQEQIISLVKELLKKI